MVVPEMRILQPFPGTLSVGDNWVQESRMPADVRLRFWPNEIAQRTPFAPSRSDRSALLRNIPRAMAQWSARKPLRARFWRR